jgi:SAM-dependent methyltransferase
MSSRNSTLEAYSAIAPVYDEYSNKRQAYLDAVDVLVISNLKPEMRLLDVGAGDGRRLLKIKAAVGLKDFVAVEPSPGMAKICEERTGAKVCQICAENLDEPDIGEFDVITALWNVFGHIPSAVRLRALRQMAARLKPGGQIMLDVNNRHNAASYGSFNVLQRVILDTLWFDEKRGDASYEWKIGEQVFQGSGHLFTPAEIEKLFRQARLKIAERSSINYATGAVSKSPYKGQLFYILTHANK